MLATAHLEEAAGPVVDRLASRGKARPLVGSSGPRRRTGPAPAEEEPALLEGLARRGHPEGQASRGDPEHFAGLGIAPSPAQRLGLRTSVGGVHRPSGEHECAAHEVRAQVTLDHEYLELRTTRPARRVPDQHDRGRRTERHGAGG